MKKLITLFILHTLLSCHKKEMKTNPFILSAEVKNKVLSYAKDLKKTFGFKEIKIIIEITPGKQDSISIIYSKIDDRDFTYKPFLKTKIYDCEEIDGFTFFYMNDSLSMFKKCTDEKQFTFKEKSDDGMYDFYPMRMVLYRKKIIYNKTESVQNIKWLGPPSPPKLH
jgi:hypothetical protein